MSRKKYYRGRCGACPYEVYGTRDTIEQFFTLHYKNCHEHTFERLVFSDSQEFLGLDFHKAKKDLIVFVRKISEQRFQEEQLYKEAGISNAVIVV